MARREEACRARGAAESAGKGGGGVGGVLGAENRVRCVASPSRTLLTELGVDGGGYAEPIDGGRGVGFCEHDVVSPGSVLKIQIALAVEKLISEGHS